MMIPETLRELVVPIESLRPYGRNPRRGDVALLRRSLEAHGQYRPLVVNRRSGEVLAGNHTLRAALELGWTEMAATFVDVDDEQAARIVLVDNRSNDLAGYDESELAGLLESLPDFEGTGYEVADIDGLLARLSGLVGRDTDPGEPPVEPTTRRGELYRLGEHRLLCGDATSEADVARLMDGALAQMVFTDPPYGVDYEGGQNAAKRDRLQGDRRGSTIYALALPVLADHSDGEAPLYLWFAGTRGDAVYRAVADAGYTVRALLVWHKIHAHYGAWMAQYMQKHEPILYCVRGTPRWHGPRNEVTVWECEQPSRNDEHPTQKPVVLAERAISNSSADGQIVLDTFAGSGSTLIAADNLGRRCYAVEIDPGYCDVIVDRWERHTGGTAERIEDGAPVEAHA